MLTREPKLTAEERRELRLEQKQAELRIREKEKFMVPNSRRALRKDYDGLKNSFGCVATGTQRYLDRLAKMMGANPAAVMESWPEVVGPAHAPMCRARSFVDGVLEVSVGNAMIYSHFRQYEYFNLLNAVRKRHPETEIKKIKFVRV